jgi:hypothetical protein
MNFFPFSTGDFPAPPAGLLLRRTRSRFQLLAAREAAWA